MAFSFQTASWIGSGGWLRPRRDELPMPGQGDDADIRVWNLWSSGDAAGRDGWVVQPWVLSTIVAAVER